MSEHVAGLKGGTASFLVVVDGAVTLRSTTPSPPGSRIEATLISDPSAGGKVKIDGSKQAPEPQVAVWHVCLDKTVVPSSARRRTRVRGRSSRYVTAVSR